MKKLIILLLLVLVLIVSVSCKTIENNNIKSIDNSNTINEEELDVYPVVIEQKESLYNEMLSKAEVVVRDGLYVDDFYKNSLKELENESDSIILGKVKSKRIIDDEESLARGTRRGTTVATIEIEKVFSSSEQLQCGDEIEIQEYCYMYTRSNGEVALSTNGYYYPVKENETYLLFLEIQDYYEIDGLAKYTPVSLWYGKYPITTKLSTAKNNNQLTCDVMELASSVQGDSVPDGVKRIFEEINSKYFSDETVKSILNAQEQFATE